MQSITKEPDRPDESTLKEMCLIVQAADAEADMGQYALETGNIVLSMPEEVSMEAMRCIGTIIPGKKPAHVALCLQEFVAEAPKLYADGPEKKDLTYGFFAARHADTVISECAVYFPHTSTEEYLPIRILSVIMIFEDGRELDYSDKISSYVIDCLAKAAW
ncbi:hypothetical protein [Candidatus Merdisoma sp. JLR.KK006]|jgi:hypothetical protein|uniref:hypothetical protein n=1 Tax=Candidatus Merdisoma sp. JLR.KK006 TaxID=3112626 RepID=UPI002FF164CA